MVREGAEVEVDGDLLVLAVGNARQAGGGRQLCPQACELLCPVELLFAGLLPLSYVCQHDVQCNGDTVATMYGEGKSCLGLTFMTLSFGRHLSCVQLTPTPPPPPPPPNPLCLEHDSRSVLLCSNDLLSMQACFDQAALVLFSPILPFPHMADSAS